MTIPDAHQEAQKAFNFLPIKDQWDMILQARGKERLYYLFLSENPEQ